MTAQEFKNLFIPHKQKLLGVATALLHHPEDAEDAVQETFIKLWKVKDSLESIVNTEAYSVTLVKNVALDMLRKRERRGYSTPIDELQLPSNETLVENILENKSDLKIIERWIEKLPKQQQLVFIYRHNKGLEIKIIAQLLKLTETNVKVILSRLRKQLKEILNSYE